jgi:DNA repair photolyase
MKEENPKKLRGRGVTENPKNRFETLSIERDPEFEEEDRAPRTQFLRDATSHIITKNASPDVGFEHSINPYRGCEHGCAYCFARPTHEYLGFSSGLDFESKIMVKKDAADLLRRELSSPRWIPQVLGMSGVTDPYQPIERKLGVTKKCLEVLAECHNPVFILTKNDLVLRDLDYLKRLAEVRAVAVCLSVTTLKDDLRKILEPRSSSPSRRLAAIEKLSRAGVPVGILMAPIIPGLTDEEIPSLLKAVADAGAKFADYVMLRLPYAVAPLFEQWLAAHFPARKENILERIRSVRGGKLYDSRYGIRLRGAGIFADQIEQLFRVSRQKAKIPAERCELSAASFRRPSGDQLLLKL